MNHQTAQKEKQRYRERKRERKLMGGLDVSLKCFTNCHYGRLSMHSFIVVGFNIMRLKIPIKFSMIIITCSFRKKRIKVKGIIFVLYD